MVKNSSLVKVKNQHIIEIGPGKGALTFELLKQKVFNFDRKDTSLFEELKKIFKKNVYL